ncbi:MAG: PQQ-binding-like beta-propeller repeat protein [Planctomycetia bacterium]|nr:MAG: PQQ-binding-like beta-propeller repeat protein [Planctomycetia bacterium]
MTGRFRQLRTGLLAILAAVLFGGADWRQFRGTDSSAVAPGQELPVRWGETENVAWKIELPGRGPSSPIVVGGHVVVTASSGVHQDLLHVICFDARSGRKQWHRRFWATGQTLCHPVSAVAAPTPASDGRRIFAFYSSNDLVCLDLAGNLLWYRGLARDYPQARNDAGMASSPLVMGETVIVQVENQGNSFAAGIDAASGVNRWRLQRPRVASWSSPVAFYDSQPRRESVLLQSPLGLTALDPQTGRKIWQYEATCEEIPSLAVGGDVLYLAAAGVTALRPPATAEPGSCEVLWSENRLGPSAASPVVRGNRIYAVNPAGVLTCGDTETGQILWRLRLKGRFWATPLVVRNRLYLFNSDGLAQVVEETGAKGKGKLIGSSDFGEIIQGTPAVADGALFVRSDRHLWKIARTGSDRPAK